MACAPPILYISVTPHSAALYNMAGFILPSLLAGVHNTTRLQPAIAAGVASINTVENRGALPPGIYKPTFSIGRLSRQQTTPLVVSILTGFCACALWNFLMLV